MQIQTLKLLRGSGYLKTILRHLLYWTPAIFFWALIRDFDNGLTDYQMNIFQRGRFHLTIGAAAAILFGSLDFFSSRYLSKRTSFGKTLLIGIMGYLIAIVLFVSFGIRAFTTIIQTNLSWDTYHGYFLSYDMILLTIYLFLVGFVIDFIKEIDKKFGPGNLWRMIKGEFHRPKEKNLIFMFLDLKGSTTIAEKLGHERYSELIQSCFEDVSEVVVEYRANIYQYVGDEIVLNWDIAQGLTNLNCLRFYFAYKRLLTAKRKYYEPKFGFVPEFKAGLEMGKVMVAEVGEIKREIAYLGDVLNTAARIQGCCNQFGKELLISERLYQSIQSTTVDAFELMGDLQLKGKQKSVRVFAVNELSLTRN